MHKNIIVLIILILVPAGSFYLLNRTRVNKTVIIPVDNNKSSYGSDISTENNPVSTSKNKIGVPKVSSKEPSKAPNVPTFLIPPEGVFVSNHRPSLDKDPNMRAEQSVCVTTPGAKCYIKFTNNDGLIHKLPEQIVDNTGSTFWKWNVNDTLLTVGSWQVTAISSLNNETKATTDALSMDVQP